MPKKGGKSSRVLGLKDLLASPIAASILLIEGDSSRLAHGNKAYVIGGAVVAPGEILVPTSQSDYTRLDCQVFLVPKKMFTGYKYRGTTLEVAVTDKEANFMRDENWKKKKTFE